MKKRIFAAALVFMMLFAAAALAGCRVTVSTNPKETFITAAKLSQRIQLPDAAKSVTEGSARVNGTIALNKLSVMGSDLLGGSAVSIDVDSGYTAEGNAAIDAVINYAGDKLHLDARKLGNKMFYKIGEIMDKFYSADMTKEAGQEGQDKPEDQAANVMAVLGKLLNFAGAEAEKTLQSIEESKFTQESATVEVNGVKAENLTAVTLKLESADVEKLVRDYANTIVSAQEFKELYELIMSLAEINPDGVQVGSLIPLAAEEPSGTKDGDEIKEQVTEALDKFFSEGCISATLKLYVLEKEAVGLSAELNAEALKDGAKTGAAGVIKADLLCTDGNIGAEAKVTTNVAAQEQSQTGDAEKPGEKEMLKLTFRKDKNAIKGDFAVLASPQSTEPAITAAIDMTSEDGVYYKGFAKFDRKAEEEADNISAKLDFGFARENGKIKFDTESLMISQGMPITIPLKINAELTKEEGGLKLAASVNADMGAMASADAKIELTVKKGELTVEEPKSVYTDEEIQKVDPEAKLKKNCPHIYEAIKGMLHIGGGSGSFEGGDGEVTGDARYVSNEASLDIVNYSDDTNHYSLTVQGKLEFEDGWVTVSALDFSEKLAFEGDPDDVSGAPVKIGGKSYYSMYYDPDDNAGNGYQMIYYRNTDDGPQAAFERVIRVEEFGTFEFDTIYFTFFSPAENNEWVINDFGKGLGIKTSVEEHNDFVSIEFTYPAGGTEKSVVEVFKTADDQGDMIRFINNETETEIYWDSEEGYAEIYFYADFTIENGMMNIFYQPEAQFALPFTDLGGGAVRIGDDTFTVSRKSDGEDDYTEYYIASESEVPLNDLYFVVFDDGSGYAGICCDLKMLQADELGDNAHLFELKYGSAGSTKVIIEELGEGAYNFRFILAEGEEYAEIFLDVPIMGVEDE